MLFCNNDQLGLWHGFCIFRHKRTDMKLTLSQENVRTKTIQTIRRVLVKKYVLNILIIALLFISNIALGQESNPTVPQFLETSQFCQDCLTDATVEKSHKTIATKELSSEELDRIIGEGPASFIFQNDNQSKKRSLAEVILWDEISKRRNASIASSIALKSGGSLMHGVQVNGVIK